MKYLGRAACVDWGDPWQHGGLFSCLQAREMFLSGERIEILGGHSKSEKLWWKSRLCWLGWGLMREKSPESFHGKWALLTKHELGWWRYP